MSDAMTAPADGLGAARHPSQSQSPSKAAASTMITDSMIQELRQRARDEPGPAPNMDKEALQTLVDKYTAAAADGNERREDDDTYSTKQQDKEARGPEGIDQFELAKTQIAKVAKTALPDNVVLRKDVLTGLIKASTVFINYLSAAAHEKTSEAGIKTLGAQHVLAAFKELHFPDEYYTKLRREYNARAKAELASKTPKSAEMAAADGMVIDDDEDDVAGPNAEESMAAGDATLAAADDALSESEESEQAGSAMEEEDPSEGEAEAEKQT